MKKSKRNIIIAGTVILLFSVGFTTIGNKDMELVKNLDIYYTMFRELNMFYVDETDPEKLVTTSINSMLSSLDPYTTYIPESDMDDFQFQTTGEYGGIGSLIRRSGEQVGSADRRRTFPPWSGRFREVQTWSAASVAVEKNRCCSGRDLHGLGTATVAFAGVERH